MCASIFYFSALTFDERGGESFLLHGAVRHELDVELVGGGADVLRDPVAAVLAEQRRPAVNAVSHLDVVVHAVVVVLHLHRLPVHSSRQESLALASMARDDSPASSTASSTAPASSTAAAAAPANAR